MNSSVSRLTSAFAIITAILVCIGTLRSASAAAVSSYQDTTTPQNQIYVFPDGTSISVQKDLGTAVAMNDPSTYSSAHELMSIIVQHFMRNHGYQNTSYTQNASGEVFQVACANGTITTAYFDAPPSPPPPPTVLSCSITFDKNPIKQGESTSISWSSTKAQLFYINGIGYVGGTGSARVSPGSTSDYSGYVNDKTDGTGNSVSCPAILTVSGSCPPDQIRVNGQCVTQCPSGFTYRDGQCVFVGCPLGYVRQGDQCVFSACPAGYVKDVSTRSLLIALAVLILAACAYYIFPAPNWNDAGQNKNAFSLTVEQKAAVLHALSQSSAGNAGATPAATPSPSEAAERLRTLESVAQSSSDSPAGQHMLQDTRIAAIPMKINQSYIRIVLGILLVASAYVFLPRPTLSQSGFTLTGWIWSDTIGWISASCTDTSSCSAVNYGFTVAADGTISGYGWSDKRLTAQQSRDDRHLALNGKTLRTIPVDARRGAYASFGGALRRPFGLQPFITRHV